MRRPPGGGPVSQGAGRVPGPGSSPGVSILRGATGPGAGVPALPVLLRHSRRVTWYQFKMLSVIPVYLVR